MKETAEIKVSDEYGALWSTSNGRNWLRATLWQSLKLTDPDCNEACSEFQKIILEHLPKRRHISRKVPPEPYVARFDISWDPWAFHINEGYSENIQEVLARAITLTESGNCKQVSTSLNYMVQTWPQTGQCLINILQYAVTNKSHILHTFSLPDSTHLSIQYSQDTFAIEVKGSEFAIVEVGEQMGWISTALQSFSHDNGVAVFCPIIQSCGLLDGLQKDKGTSDGLYTCPGFTITSKQSDHIPLGFDIPGDCWKALFCNPVLVQGYPILERDGPELGIEIPTGIMAKLLQANHITTFMGRFFIKGYSALAVAVRREGQCVIWHHIYRKDGDYISYNDANIAPKLREGMEGISRIDISTCRHILGWCDDAINYTGTDKADLNIKSSGESTERVDSKVILDRITFGLAPPHTPLSLNFSCAVGKKDKPAHISSDCYEKQLQKLGRKRVLLYDTADHIGWVVDGASALLHLVRAQLKHDAEEYEKIHLFQFDLRKLKGPPKDLAYAGHLASMSVLTNPQNRELPVGGKRVEHYLETTAKASKEANSSQIEEVKVERKTKEVPICFQQTVEDMYSSFELILAHEAERLEKDGVSLPIMEKIQGYNFSDIYQSDGALYARQAHRKHKGAKLVKSLRALTLFGDGFGKLIRAVNVHQLCTGCFFEADVPRGQDLFVASGKELQAILQENHNGTGAHWDRMDKTHWHESKQCFGCSCEKAKKSGKLRSMSLISKTRRSTPAHSPIRSERAAAIFPYNSIKWGDDVHTGPWVERSHVRSGKQNSCESTESGREVRSTSSLTEPTYPIADSAISLIPSTSTATAVSDESTPMSCDASSANDTTFSLNGRPSYVWPGTRGPIQGSSERYHMVAASRRLGTSIGLGLTSRMLHGGIFQLHLAPELDHCQEEASNSSVDD